MPVDISQAAYLLHSEETVVYGDAGYLGIEKRPEIGKRQVEWRIAERRGRIKAMPESIEKEFYTEWERRKAQVRARVEHPFHIIKNIFKYRKVRYRGISKNLAQLYSLFALANLVIVKRKLLAT